MKTTNCLKILVIFAGLFLFCTAYGAEPENKNLLRAQTTLQQIFSLYDAGHDHLLNETYPYKAD